MTPTTRSQTRSPSHLSLNSIRAVMDSLPSHIALLNADGEIIATNSAWKAFALAAGADPARTGVGVDYLSVCDLAASDLCEGGARFAEGLRQVMAGRLESFELDDRQVLAFERRIVRGRVTRVEDPRGTHYLVTHEVLPSRGLSAA